MTFVLSLGNSEQVIQVSDRLLSDAEGRHAFQPEHKVTALTVDDGRLLVGFSGLALAPGFRASDWILDVLQAGGGAGAHTVQNMVTYFVDAATERFRERRVAAVDSRMRRFSALFSGYQDFPKSRIIAAHVSNHIDWARDRDVPAQDTFNVKYWQAREDEANPTLILRIGAWNAMTGGDEHFLRAGLEEHKSADAIAALGVATIRRIAERRGANGSVGREITSAVLPVAQPGQPRGLIFGYHPEAAQNRVLGVNQVMACSGTPALVVKDMVIEPVDDLKPEDTMSVPPVGRNQPCPCGSGKRYKHCHGKGRPRAR